MGDIFPAVFLGEFKNNPVHDRNIPLRVDRTITSLFTFLYILRLVVNIYAGLIIADSAAVITVGHTFRCKLFFLMLFPFFFVEIFGNSKRNIVPGKSLILASLSKNRFLYIKVGLSKGIFPML